MTCSQSFDYCTTHGHMITIWVLDNWLVFTTDYTVPWPRDCGLCSSQMVSDKEVGLA